MPFNNSVMEIKSEKTVYGGQLFPAAWQNVLFINYGKVADSVLADVLKTDIRTIRREAERLGLEKICFNVEWKGKGYISLIRNNWHFLSVSQTAKLIGVSSEELEKILIDDDFLFIKLGSVKPDTGETVYSPLSEADVKRTEEIAANVRREFIPYERKPFDFKIAERSGKISRGAGGERVLYNYNALYGDALLEGKFDNYSEEYLRELAANGVTGLWLSGQLSYLSADPFAAAPDDRYILRRRNLNKLCGRCAKYGIKIFLYLNEPRARETKFVPQDLRGHTERGFSSLCLEHADTCGYLSSAVEDLCRNVPSLGGLITITMSENLTHCRSLAGCNCAKCRNIPPQRLAAKVNNLIAEGVRRAGSSAKVIANLWGWSSFMGWTDEMVCEGIALLDNDIEVMVVSEYGKKIEKGGVPSQVIDYSLSNVGPSESSKKIMEYAVSSGRTVWAKIQVNNSWECSSVPFLPVYALVAEHADNLDKLGVENFMLSWTLGGYPSFGLRLIDKKYRGKRGLARFFAEGFGKNAAVVENATNKLCEAMREFPFSLNVLYFAPHTMGGGEFWTTEKISSKATMVGFSYDDIDFYSIPFGSSVYVLQMEKLTEGFRSACELLNGIDGGEQLLADVKLFSEVTYLHYRSALNHARFTLEKRRNFPDKEKALSIVADEMEAVRRLYALQSRDARIGFEASNQYYYNENTLLAKLVCLGGIAKKIENL